MDDRCFHCNGLFAHQKWCPANTGRYYKELYDEIDQLRADLTACRARVGELEGVVLMELQALHDKWAINRNDHGCVKDLGDLIVRLEQAWGGEG